MFTMPDRFATMPHELGLQLASREVSALIEELEPSLTTHQVSLLHQLRLAAESLGAARVSSRYRVA